MADSYVYNGPHERLFLRREVCLHRGVPVELDGDPAALADAHGDVDRITRHVDPAPESPKPRPSTSDIRRWAIREGIGVPRKGRLPESVVRAYLTAHDRG